MSLREYLANLIHESETQFMSDAELLADRILALPEMVSLQEKANRFDELHREFGDSVYCSDIREWQEKARKWDSLTDTTIERHYKVDLQEKGWLHEDDPVEGLEVVEKCPERSVLRYKDGYETPCLNCGGTNEIVRPLTVGEALDLAQTMEWCGVPKGRIMMVLPSGGRVRVKR